MLWLQTEASDEERRKLMQTCKTTETHRLSLCYSKQQSEVFCNIVLCTLKMNMIFCILGCNLLRYVNNNI